MFLHPTSPASLSRFAQVLAMSASLAAATSLDSLRLGAIAVRSVLPKSTGRCLSGYSDTTLSSHWSSSLGSVPQFRPDSSSSALLRLRVDTADGLCDLTLDFQDSLGRATERVTLAPGGVLLGSDALPRLLAQVSQALRKERSGSVEIATTPSGAHLALSGIPVGATPQRLEGLVSGPLAMTLSLEGWNPVSETLSVQPGRNLTIQRELTRTSAWLDSVRRAAIAHRRDSIWNDARTRPAQGLSELFDRLAAAVASGSRMPVAILPFDALGEQGGSYDPGVMAAEYGVARWSGDPRFVVLERTGVRKLVSEQAFQASGAVSDSDAAAMGKLAAAKYLVTGTVQTSGGKQSFTARLVSVETGEIVSGAVSETPSRGMDSLYRDALGEKGQLSATVYRSLAGPGWGQFYTNHPVHGGVALGAVVATIGLAAWAYLDYADKDDQLQKYRHHDVSTVRAGDTEASWTVRAESARKERNDAATVLGVSLGAVGIAWTANVLDAAVLGYMESRRIRAKYFAFAPTAVVRPEGLALAWRF